MKLKRICASLLTALLLGSLAAPAAVAASAQNNYGLSEFVMVLIPGEDTEKSVQLRDDMSKALSEAIGIPVTTYRATDYTAAVEAMRTGHAQLALLGPFSYVSARERSGAEVMVVTATDGQTGYYSQIITRADSGIQTLADLKGKTFAFVDPESTSGNIIPSDTLIKAMPELNLTFDDLHTDGVFFKSAMFAGTHPSAIQAVIKGNVDAAGVSSSTLANQIKQGNVNEADIKIISQSALIPSSPIAIKKDLPQELKDKVLAFLLAYDNEEYFGGPNKRYVQVSDSDYDYLAELKETYGLTD
jgi:phosphonate transport system substrate-binding protein